MRKKIVFMFSGQGSQYYQMGGDLFDCNAEFRNTMVELDDIVRDIINESILVKMHSKSQSDEFKRTLYTHPAIFMVEYALARTLMKKQIFPDLILGSSLGEYTSAVIGGVLEPKDAIDLIIRQAVLIEKYCEKGYMMAILDNPNHYKNSQLNDLSEMVSINSNMHYIVSIKEKNLEQVQKILNYKEIVFQLLPVSYAFHSTDLDPIESYYKSILKEKLFNTSNIPLVSSVYGEVLLEVSPEYFWKVIREPIQTVKAITRLESQNDYVYLDLGPGGTLSNLVIRNLSANSRSRTFPIINAFSKAEKYLNDIETYFDYGNFEG